MTVALESWSPGGGGDDHLPRARRRCLRHPRRAPRPGILALPRVPGYRGDDVRDRARVRRWARSGDFMCSSPAFSIPIEQKNIWASRCRGNVSVLLFWSHT